MSPLPRVGVDFGSTEIKILWITPACQVKLIDNIPLPIQSRDRRVTHSSTIVLNRVRQIPDRLRFDGPWDASVSSQRSTFILWDRQSGKSMTPLISWRDRRGASIVEGFTEEQFDSIRRITGLRPEPGYPLSKLIRLLREDEELASRASDGEVCYGSLDTWLLWKATGGEVYRMDSTQASRTLLYDVNQHRWSRELMSQFDLPQSMFPPIRDEIRDPIPTPELWPDGRIVNLIGDQPAATIGGQPPPYEFTRVTLGTGGFVASPASPNEVPPSLALTFTPSPQGSVYQAEGAVLSAGRALDWLHNVFGLERETVNDFVHPPWPDRVPFFCPALNGVGAPFWSDRDAVMQGFTEDTSTKQIFTGMVVSILFRVRDILEELPTAQPRVILDGGMTFQPWIPSLAAALWDVPISQALTPHLTPRGAVVASHWELPYFDVDPWESVNLEVKLADDRLPVDRWWDEWRQCLDDWGLEPVR